MNKVIDWSQFDTLCDVGFLSFTIGVKGGLGSWSSIKPRFSKTVVVLDSTYNHRYLLNPQYKSQRKEKRDRMPEFMAKYELAKAFADMLRGDPQVFSTELYGFEADDILSYLFIKGIGTSSLIGADKDLYQIPGLRDVMSHLNGEQTKREMKLPKYHPQPEIAQEYLLAQVIRGDKSDSIQRIFPSSGPESKVLFNEMILDKTPDEAWWNLCYKFGHDIIFENIFLMLMPSPLMSKQYSGYLDFNDPNEDFLNIPNQIDRLALLDKIIDGSYWKPENFSDEFFELLIKQRSSNLSKEWGNFEDFGYDFKAFYGSDDEYDWESFGEETVELTKEEEANWVNIEAAFGEI